MGKRPVLGGGAKFSVAVVALGPLPPPPPPPKPVKAHLRDFHSRLEGSLGLARDTTATIFADRVLEEKAISKFVRPCDIVVVVVDNSESTGASKRS